MVDKYVGWPFGLVKAEGFIEANACCIIFIDIQDCTLKALIA
jgi:hypothetical protein